MPNHNNSELLPIELKKIGIRLRTIRKSMGYGNSDSFANHYDLDRAQYGKYETGSQDLRMSSLLKILEKIDFTLPQFFNAEFDNIEI